MEARRECTVGSVCICLILPQRQGKSRGARDPEAQRQSARGDFTKSGARAPRSLGVAGRWANGGRSFGYSRPQRSGDLVFCCFVVLFCCFVVLLFCFVVCCSAFVTLCCGLTCLPGLPWATQEASLKSFVASDATAQSRTTPICQPAPPAKHRTCQQTKPPSSGPGAVAGRQRNGMALQCKLAEAICKENFPPCLWGDASHRGSQINFSLFSPAASPVHLLACALLLACTHQLCPARFARIPAP